MDEAQNNYMNIGEGLYSSTLPLDNDFEFAEEIDLSKIFYFGEGNADHLPNIFDFGEEDDLSKIFDNPKDQSVNTNIIPSISFSPDHLQNSETVSELPDSIPKGKQPMVTINCPTYSSVDENSSRIAHQINHDDDYSLSYIHSMGLNNTMLQDGGGTTSYGINQEDPEIFIPMPIVVEKQGVTINSSRKKEQENPDTNNMILQQPLPKIPVLEKLERESSLKLKFVIDQPLKISADFGKEQDNPCMKRSFMKSSSFEILEQEKLMILNKESDFMKPKFFMNNPHGISTSMRAKEQESPKTNDMILQKEQKNPTTNDMILQRSMPHILTLEKVESQLMLGQENRIFKQRIGNDSYGILSSLDNEFQQKKSANGGPIRRSPNRTSSRYQPFGREIDPNNHGSDRVRHSNSELIFTGSQNSGIASSSHHRYMLLNNIQGNLREIS